MASRLDLQTKLEELIANRNVYFQPPSTVSISYPCIIYNIGNGDVKRANNNLYSYTNNYQLTMIYKKPMVDIIETMLRSFQMCKLDRTYVSDNLYHYVFSIYF